MITRLSTLLSDGGDAAPGPDSTGPGERGDQASDRPDATTDGPTQAAASDRPPDDPAFDVDQVFDVLKNQRRRRVMAHLGEADGQLTLGTLAERIAAEECDKPVQQINSQERKRVYVGLYQCHLPKMDDVGAIEYDKSRGTIDPGAQFDRFERYLPEDRPATPVWQDRLHDVSIVGLVAIPVIALIAAAAAGALWEPVLFVSIAASIAVALVLAVHAYY